VGVAGGVAAQGMNPLAMHAIAPRAAESRKA
jgi:hypothetical protein